MSNRNRTISQSEALYIGPVKNGFTASGHHFTDSGGTGTNTASGGDNLVKQLFRIQSLNHSFNISRQDVRQFGQFGRIDSVILEPPTAPLDFSYLISNVENERRLGLAVDGVTPVISGLLDKTEEDRNYYIRVAPEGTDVIGRTATDDTTIAIGNGHITSYQVEASVGNLPTATVNVEAQNVMFLDAVSGWHIPAVDPESNTLFNQRQFALEPAVENVSGADLDISTLKPNDISMSFEQRDASDEGSVGNTYSAWDTPGAKIDSSPLQSFTLSFDLNRDMIQKLGSRFNVSREISPGSTATLQTQALVTDITTGSLHEFINCSKNYKISIDMKDPACLPGESQRTVARYTLENAEVDSWEYSSSLDDNKTVTINWSVPLTATASTDIGLFVSGLSLVNP